MKHYPFVPSIFTILNLFSGFTAVTQVFSGRYITAITLIIVAGIFDVLDGKFARLLSEESDFGLEFDSLADVVSFCVAPSVLVYSLFGSEYFFIGAVVSFFPLVFGAIRLARFNVWSKERKNRVYLGLPVPASAITISSYIWFSFKLFGNYGDPKIILPLIILLSTLMVSHIRFSGFPEISFSGDIVVRIKSSVTLTLILLMIIFPGYAIFPVLVIFILDHLFIWLSSFKEPVFNLIIKRRNR